MSRFWCKTCEIFIDDNKLSRKQHELSERHKGGIQRAINELHKLNRENQRNSREPGKSRASGIAKESNKTSTKEADDNDPADTASQAEIGEWEEVTQSKPALRTLGSPLQVPDEKNEIPRELKLTASELEARNWDFKSEKKINDVILSDDEDGASKKPVIFKKRKMNRQ